MKTNASLPIAEQHLDLLIMRRQVASWIAAVLVLPTPLVAPGCELVSCEGATAWCETAGDDYAALPIPALVALQHLSVHSHILQITKLGVSLLAVI